MRWATFVQSNGVTPVSTTKIPRGFDQSAVVVILNNHSFSWTLKVKCVFISHIDSIQFNFIFIVYTPAGHGWWYYNLVLTSLQHLYSLVFIETFEFICCCTFLEICFKVLLNYEPWYSADRVCLWVWSQISTPVLTSLDTERSWWDLTVSWCHHVTQLCADWSVYDITVEEEPEIIQSSSHCEVSYIISSCISQC